MGKNSIIENLNSVSDNFIMIISTLVTKLCKENNLSEEQTVKHINDNLKINGLI